MTLVDLFATSERRVPDRPAILFRDRRLTYRVSWAGWQLPCPRSSARWAAARRAIESLGERHIWPHEFMEHLTKVIGTIGAHGNAVIVGRGASHILPPEACLRVLVIAPLEVRVNNVSSFFKVSKDEAKQRILTVESERVAFARKYFNLDPLDPNHYDLVINSQYFLLDQASKIIVEAYNSRDWQDFSAKKVIK